MRRLRGYRLWGIVLGLIVFSLYSWATFMHGNIEEDNFHEKDINKQWRFQPPLRGIHGMPDEPQDMRQATLDVKAPWRTPRNALRPGQTPLHSQVPGLVQAQQPWIQVPGGMPHDLIEGSHDPLRHLVYHPFNDEGKHITLINVTAQAQTENKCITYDLPPYPVVCLRYLGICPISEALWKGLPWEMPHLEVLRNALVTDRSLGVLDIGAHLGMLTLIGGKLRRRVVTLETRPNLVKTIHHSLWLNQVEKYVDMVVNPVGSTNRMTKIPDDATRDDEADALVHHLYPPPLDPAPDEAKPVPGAVPGSGPPRIPGATKAPWEKELEKNDAKDKNASNHADVKNNQNVLKPQDTKRTNQDELKPQRGKKQTGDIPKVKTTGVPVVAVPLTGKPVVAGVNRRQGPPMATQPVVCVTCRHEMSIRLDDLLQLTKGWKGAVMRLDLQGQEHMLLPTGRRLFQTLKIPVIVMKWNKLRAYNKPPPPPEPPKKKEVKEPIIDKSGIKTTVFVQTIAPIILKRKRLGLSRDEEMVNALLDDMLSMGYDPYDPHWIGYQLDPEKWGEWPDFVVWIKDS